MDFRVLSRLFAWFDLFMSTIFLTIVLFSGFKMLHDTIFQYEYPSELYTVAQRPSWMLFAISLFYCSVDIVANRRLLAATKKGADPKNAIHLSDLYWFVQFISMVIGVLRLVSIEVNQQKISTLYRECNDEFFCWRHFLDLGLLCIDCLGLLCVYLFRRELKASVIPHHQNLTNKNFIHQKVQPPTPSH